MSYTGLIEPGVKSGNRYSLGSCRRDQGYFWSSKGGIVIEIVNPESPPSKFEFDRYDKGAITHTDVNDGLSKGMSKGEALNDLRAKIINACSKNQ